DTYTRCRAFAAVERAGFAIESHGKVNLDQVRQMLAPFEPVIAFQALNGGGFAHRVASLDKAEWQRIAAAAPDANEEAVAPLVNAGTALIDFFGGRSDDEAVAAWHAVSALVQRHHLTPIKFAASYAPFASAIPVTNPRSLGAMVSRYVTAVGRLGASQCATLAEPWQIGDELSSALSKALVDGSARAGEESAALAAVVTVPMRLATAGGWAAVKTAAFAGGAIARLADSGAEVTYVIVTDGRQGGEDPTQKDSELVAIRAREQRAAAKVLGVKRVEFLGYKDGHLSPDLKLRRDIVRQIRK